ncbi:MAG: thioredoxin domain-containing protein, partial [bacterium]
MLAKRILSGMVVDASMPSSLPTPPHVPKPWAGFLLVVGALVLILLGFFGYGVLISYRQYQKGALDTNRYGSSLYTASGARATTTLPRIDRSQVETSDDPSVGPEDAMVTIVEFGDFECPFCGEAFPVLKNMLKKYGDKIRFIYRDFPNPDIHPNALPAALAASCAQEEGKFWPYFDLLFGHQQQLTSDELRSTAQTVGLNLTAYDQCLSTKRHLQ